MHKAFKASCLESVFILPMNMLKAHGQRISEGWCFTIRTPHYCTLKLRHKFIKAANTNCIEVILKRFPSGEDYIIEGFAKFEGRVHKDIIETVIGSRGNVACIQPANKEHFYRRIEKYT